MKLKLVVFVLIVIAALGYFSFYVVDETKQVVVTQFGRVVGEPVTEPGLNFKLPFIHQANHFPKNLLHWDGTPGQIPTLDKTYIWVDVFARWKIVDSIAFFQTVENIFSAVGRLDDIIDPAVRNLITSNPLIETVRKSSRELDTFEVGLEDIKKDQTAVEITKGREIITEEILKQAQPKLEKFGIELVDVKIKRVNYVQQVRQSVYGRMIAERKQIAAKFRSEGKGESNKISGEKDRDLKQITSEAYRVAQKIKGKADAESAAIFAKAFGKDPEFYSFVKSLEIYNESLNEKSTVVLSTDSQLLKYFQKDTFSE